jgi:hypothetical protein
MTRTMFSSIRENDERYDALDLFLATLLDTGTKPVLLSIRLMID